MKKLKDKNKIILSIIIVTYNSEGYINKCLNSIPPTVAKNINFEIIIVDNNSLDKTTEAIKKSPKNLILIKNSENLGFAKACNQGAKIAKGEYQFFLNPDTIVKKDAIINLLTFLKNNPKAGVVGPLLLRPNRDIVPWQMGYEKTIWRAILEVIVEKIVKVVKTTNVFKLASFVDLNYADPYKTRDVDWVNGAALMVRKRIFDAVKGFDERFFLYYEEIDLQKRIKSLGWKIYHVPESVIVHYGKRSFKDTDYKPYLKKSRYLYFKKYYPAIFTLIYHHQ